MKKIVYFLLLYLLSSPAYAASLACEAFYQAPGKELERQALEVETSNESHKIFVGSLHGYDFRADWDRALAAVFLSMSQGGSEVLYSTARLPTATQPQTYVRLSLPEGTLVSLTCLMR